MCRSANELSPGDPLWCFGSPRRDIPPQPAVFTGMRMSGDFAVTLADGRDVSLAPDLFKKVGVTSTP